MLCRGDVLEMLAFLCMPRHQEARRERKKWISEVAELFSKISENNDGRLTKEDFMHHLNNSDRIATCFHKLGALVLINEEAGGMMSVDTGWVLECFGHALVLEALNFFSMLKMVQVCNQLDCNPRAQTVLMWQVMHAACSLPERWHALQRGLLGKACHDMAWYGMSKIHLLSFIYIIGRHLFGDLWVPFPSYFRAVLLEKRAKTSKKRSFMQVGQVKTRLTSP